MKLKRTNKLLAWLLAVLMVMSLLPVTALAGDNDITIIIDLTNYHGAITDITINGFTNTTVVAGQKNSFSCTGGESPLNATFTLANFNPSSYGKWIIDGSLMNGSDIETRTINDSDNNTINIINNPDAAVKKTIMRIETNKFSFNPDNISKAMLRSFLKGWGYGSTIIIAPNFSTYTATANSSNDNQGTVKAKPTADLNTYKLTAFPKDGYAFSYWLKENDADTEANRISANPYTVTLDADATFTAYFRDRYTLTAATEDESKGTAAAVWTGSANGVDNYTLTAMPAAYYEFDKWTCGDTEYTDNPLDVSVTESGKTYTAHFKPVELTLGDGAVLVNSTSVINGYSTGVFGSSGIPSVGSRTALYIPVTIPQDLTDVTVGLTVTDEQNQELAS